MSAMPVVLGVDFGGTKIAVGACDLDGRRLASTTLSGRRRPRRGRHPAPRDRRRPCAAPELPAAELSAVGVATFGIPAADHIGLAPTIDGWDRLALRDELSAAFTDVPVSVMTDVKAAALAEARWGSLVDCDPGLYLNLGTGLAAAVVVGGRVVRGHHGASGEIGYNLRSRDDVDVPIDVAGPARGPRQRAGDRGAGPGAAGRHRPTRWACSSSPRRATPARRRSSMPR